MKNFKKWLIAALIRAVRTFAQTLITLIGSDYINIDLDKFQDGINSLSKAVGLFSDLFASKDVTNDTYKPRAIYKRFDD